jgi:hypothetical protein
MSSIALCLYDAESSSSDIYGDEGGESSSSSRKVVDLWAMWREII